ncbi:MAG: hypothetical protein K2Q34_06505 [Alphaproteobacteria bacterium]|nr:hypothetical protein [Alphaproteobacteria bacterium]
MELEDPSSTSFHNNVEDTLKLSEDLYGKTAIETDRIRRPIASKLEAEIRKLDPADVHFIYKAYPFLDMAKDFYKPREDGKVVPEVRRIKSLIGVMIKNKIDSHTSPDESSIAALRSHLGAAKVVFGESDEETIRLEDLLKIKEPQMKRGQL